MKESLDDPVVYEADIHFAPKRKGDFYLFQFAHNASPFSTKRQSLGSIKSKPKLSQFEIELLLNTQSETFDFDKSKRIAFNVDDNLREQKERKGNRMNDDEKFFPNNIMNKQVLSSEKLASTGFQFALAYLRDNVDQVKLIPIKSIIDFKPAFRYLDKIKVKTNNKNQNESDESDEEPPKPEEAQTTKKVTMRFANKNEKKSNETSTEEEKWQEMKFFDYGIPKFEKEKDVILYKVNQEVNDDESMKDKDELNSSHKFSYEEFALNSDQIETANSAKFEEVKIDILNTLPFYQTCSLHLKDQIRSLLCSSKVISFDKCVQLLKMNLEKNRLVHLNNSGGKEKKSSPTNRWLLELDAVIKYLEQYALLVQGNWVVKSEIIYPKTTTNSYNSRDYNSIPFSNISVEMLCNARDYVLYKFTKRESLSRKELIEQIRIPADAISEILKQFSSYNKESNEWQFIYPRDDDFIDQYRTICQKQDMIWEEKSKTNSLFCY